MANDQLTTATTKIKQSFFRYGIKKFFRVLFLLALLGAGGYSYQVFIKHQAQTNRELKSVHATLIEQENHIHSLEKNTAVLKQTLTATQGVFSEQAQLFKDWHLTQQGNFDKWRIAEAYYLVKAANVQLQFMQQLALGITLLKFAEQILAPLSQNTISLHQAVVSDLTRLQMLPKFDVTQVALALTALKQEINHLPLLIAPKTKLTIHQPVLSQASTWWQQVLNSINQILQQIVIIKRLPNAIDSIVLPDQQPYLYQRLYEQIDNALWALLHQNARIYQLSLNNIAHLVDVYCERQAKSTQQFQQRLAKLKNIEIYPANVTIAISLQAFNRYYEQSRLLGVKS